MGDGEKDLWELPWTNLINKTVVQKLVNDLFTKKDDSSEGFIEVINSLFKTTVADWEQNDSNSYDYIKNKICSASYDLLNPKFNIFTNNNMEFSEKFDFEGKSLHVREIYLDPDLFDVKTIDSEL
jgi:hypothetical protein